MLVKIELESNMNLVGRLTTKGMFILALFLSISFLGFIVCSSAAVERIQVEGADSILEKTLVSSENLKVSTRDVAPRILVEYADSIFTVLLKRPPLVGKLSSSLTISSLTTSVSLNETITVSGSISPPLAGITFTLTYTKPDGTLLTKTVVTKLDGSYADIFKPDQNGRWEVKASWIGDEDYYGAESMSVSFSVTPSPTSTPTPTPTPSPTPLPTPSPAPSPTLSPTPIPTPLIGPVPALFGIWIGYWIVALSLVGVTITILVLKKRTPPEPITIKDAKVVELAKEYGGILTPSVLAYKADISIEKALKVLNRFVKLGEAQIRKVREMRIYDFPSARTHLTKVDKTIIDTLLSLGGRSSRVQLLMSLGMSIEAFEEAMKHLESYGIIIYDKTTDEYSLRFKL